MNFLLICLFIATLFPYLAKLPVAWAMQRTPAGYDNHHPREQQASLSGMGARAVAAHQNSFEALLIFSTAVLAALATHHDTPLVRTLAVLWLVSRVVYHLLYLLNFATLRTLVWGIGLAAALGILGSCIS